MDSFTTISTAYKPAVTASLISQGILLIVSEVWFLSFHPRVFFAALLSYWVVTVLLILIRPQSPGRLVLGFIAFGFVVLYAGAFYLEPLIWE